MILNTMAELAELTNTTVNKLNAYRRKKLLILPKKIGTHRDLNGGYYDIHADTIAEIIRLNKISIAEWYAKTSKDKYGHDILDKGSYKPRTRIDECDASAAAYVANLERQQEEREQAFKDRTSIIENFNPDTMAKVREDLKRKKYLKKLLSK